MSLENKIDFMVLVSVTNANPNGDPLDDKRPRTDYNGYGEISDVCIKRKIRNRMQDMGKEIFVKSDDRSDDGCISLKERAKDLAEINDADKFSKKACEKWLDVRSFGQVFAFDKGFGCKSVGVRGPVSIHQASSINPVEIRSMQITKSVSGDRKDASKRGRDTMGMKHFVRFGLYKIKGSINVQLAEKTSFSEDDAETIKKCLSTLFVNDASSARPEGSMEVFRVYWWEHNCKEGQYPSAKVHKSVHIELKDNVAVPLCVNDYKIEYKELPGLKCEVFDGM